MEKNKQPDYKELFEITLKDLIQISASSYNLMRKGLYLGEISDEVSSHMEVCAQLVQKFAKNGENDDIHNKEEPGSTDEPDTASEGGSKVV